MSSSRAEQGRDRKEGKGREGWRSGGGGGWEKETRGEGVLRGDVGSGGWKRQRGARVVEVEGLKRDGGEGEKDPRKENKDENEKQDGIKMLGIIKKKCFFFSPYHVACHVFYSSNDCFSSCVSRFFLLLMHVPL